MGSRYSKHCQLTDDMKPTSSAWGHYMSLTLAFTPGLVLYPREPLWAMYENLWDVSIFSITFWEGWVCSCILHGLRWKIKRQCLMLISVQSLSQGWDPDGSWAQAHAQQVPQMYTFGIIAKGDFSKSLRNTLQLLKEKDVSGRILSCNQGKSTLGT